MQSNPRRNLISVTIWCLLALWLFFGCLEFAEQVSFLPETAAEDQAGADLDEDALLQLASALKSDISPFSVPSGAVFNAAVVPLIVFFSNTSHQRTQQNGSPFSMRVLQFHPVYRI